MTRIASELTNNPMSASVPRTSRPAVGVPNRQITLSSKLAEHDAERCQSYHEQCCSLIFRKLSNSAQTVRIKGK